MIIGLQQFRRSCFLSFLFLISAQVIELLPMSQCSGEGSLTNEEIAIRCVRESNPASVWTDYEVVAKEESPSCIRNSKLYKTTVEGPVHPSPVALVVIGDDKVPYFFPPYKAYRYYDRFSKVIVKERLNITEDNLVNYVKILLCLLDMRSFQIAGIEELQFLPLFIKKDIAKYGGEVKPPQMRIEGNEASIVFYAWHPWGRLSRWKLNTSLNGEILFVEVNDLATYKIGVY
jgi:hypothetical protein